MFHRTRPSRSQRIYDLLRRHPNAEPMNGYSRCVGCGYILPSGVHSDFGMDLHRAELLAQLIEDEITAHTTQHERDLTR